MMGACDHYCAVLYFFSNAPYGLVKWQFLRAYREPMLHGSVASENERFFRAVMCVRKHRDINPAMNHANDHAKRVSKIKEIKIAHTNRKQP